MKKDILIFLPDLFFISFSSLPTYFVMLDAGCTHRLHAWKAETTVIGGGCCEHSTGLKKKPKGGKKGVMNRRGCGLSVKQSSSLLFGPPITISWELEDSIRAYSQREVE
jgi:hypothetical protein